MTMTNPLKNKVVVLLLVLFVVIMVLSTTPWINKISESIKSEGLNVTAVYLGTTAPPTERGSLKLKTEY
ncbi:hypothetical protein [Thermococcus peptonophilus]|uniref:hypothetical protein n=1 Tax=Thermococcus peptonophilus TaxID=53952 RepID=UPI003467AF41